MLRPRPLKSRLAPSPQYHKPTASPSQPVRGPLNLVNSSRCSHKSDAGPLFEAAAFRGLHERKAREDATKGAGKCLPEDIRIGIDIGIGQRNDANLVTKLRPVV